MTNVIPAATLVLFRRAGHGAPPELLMLERGRMLAFAPGALVFPGGRVDPGDAAVAADEALRIGAALPDPADAAARVAAIRETIEEAGVAVGLSPAPAPVTIAALRSGLAGGEAFDTLLRQHGLRLRLDALTPYARWQPPGDVPRLFDTRFYVAAAPAGALAEADGSESRAARWTSATAALAEAASGRAILVFPTLCNLHRLAGHDDLAAAEADARLHPPRLIVPTTEEREGTSWLTIPPGLGYPFTRQPLAEAGRGMASAVPRP